MDPNSNLDRQRSILAELRELQEESEQAQERGEDTSEYAASSLHLLTELAGLTEDLDCWLSNHGLPPTAWSLSRV